MMGMKTESCVVGENANETMRAIDGGNNVDAACDVGIVNDADVLNSMSGIDVLNSVNGIDVLNNVNGMGTTDNGSNMSASILISATANNVIADKEESTFSKIYDKYPLGETSKGKVLVENIIFKTYIYIHSDDTRLLAARRTLCGFNIYSVQENNKLIAVLRANIFGTKYHLDDSLDVKYETSFLQRGRPRAFAVGLDGLGLCNKKPYFNNETQSFSLNFNGRVTQPSVRNLQIIHPLDPTYITLTFGKENDNTYILDFSYPWAAIKAFCIALSALDHKFGCD